MTPVEKNIVKALVAVAWADGNVATPEQGMIESLLWAFDATEKEEEELREYAKSPVRLEDINLGSLTRDDKEVLLSHAALLTHSDGEQTEDEKRMLAAIIKVTELPAEQAKGIIKTARERADKLASRI